jgi:tRNA(Ile)-lysidine synthase
VAVDADKLSMILTLRYIKAGERFHPYGMKGSKLVNDYLTDVKVSRFEKQKQCVVCSEGEIVWLVGQRVDQRFAIMPETKRVVLFELI